MTEHKVYVCAGCGEQRVEEIWEAPVFNGFQKTEQTVKFFPESIKCNCGSKFYQEGVNPFSPDTVMRHGTTTEPSVWEQVKNRPRGDF